MEIIPPKKIKIVKTPGKGRGVVATEDIKKGEIIETCPVVFISDKEAELIGQQKEVLEYYYLLQSAINKHSIMLGYGSLYNHSKNPNADIDYDTKDCQDYIVFEAIKDIKKGEEIVYDYEFESGVEEFLKLD